MDRENLKISYHIADTKGDRRHVRPSDVVSDYESFDEAYRNLEPPPAGHRAILANINGEWYVVSKDYDDDGVKVRYRPLDKEFWGWHTIEETLAGVDINNIPTEKMIAMAATVGFCDGNLAKWLGVKEETIWEYGFYEKFTEFFGYPMSDLEV